MAGRLKRPGYLLDAVAAIAPDENLAELARSVAAGEVPQGFRVAMERAERALEAIGKALAQAQPAGAEGRISVRWWRMGGAMRLRTPVLVRDLRKGAVVQPVRLLRRDVKPRIDQSFALNADLVPGLLEAYWRQYHAWRALAGQWTALRSLARQAERVVQQAGSAADEAAAQRALASSSARLRAAGYVGR